MNHGDEVVNTKQHFYSLSSFCDLAILEFKNVTNNDDEGKFGGIPQVQTGPNTENKMLPQLESMKFSISFY